MGRNSENGRPSFWRGLLERAKTALIGLASWVVLTLGLIVWWRLAPESMPQLAFIALFGSVIGAPLVAMSIIIGAMMESTRDRELPARDASDRAEAAMRESLASEETPRSSAG